MSQIHVKENSKTIWPFAHIPMYAGLRFIFAYIHENGFKIRVWKIMHVFRDDIGNIKKYKKGPWGPKSLQRDRGRPYKCDSPGAVK